MLQLFQYSYNNFDYTISKECYNVTGAISYGARKIGRVVVIGSATMFEDAWLNKEDNAKLLDFVMSWLSQQISLEVSLFKMIMKL